MIWSRFTLWGFSGVSIKLAMPLDTDSSLAFKMNNVLLASSKA